MKYSAKAGQQYDDTGHSGFRAGEDSLKYSAEIGDDERRGEKPQRSPRAVKEEIAGLLGPLREEGLKEQTERNIESYFTVADAFEADGLLVQAVDYLEDLAHKLGELVDARAGRKKWDHGLIETEADILHFRDCHNLHVVDEKYMTGAQPTEKGYRWLRSKGVTAVINLRLHSEHDRELVESLEMKHFHIAWPDEQPPTVSQVEEMLRAVEETPGRVFQHCLRGIGRDMTMAGCYVIANHGESASEFIRKGCQEAPRWESDQRQDDGTGEPAQFKLLREFEEGWR
ncbi:MAG: hypothetical protein AVDCRST_MAG14-2517 [uncultured Rubrobacteraceae bacterium]|uniref:DSP-PTPase phosphatase fused to NAD+ Kinase domain-containing protein n=1 Tax=uncultured Rubrobacteraceae bacterium TaxID=349277 RepID=A0A6J4R364_9ACTN|nr:MAG: hypothetical protein AVDCRST_MAG14-2517 [uncultured Rubrobacteraceae bacterium]